MLGLGLVNSSHDSLVWKQRYVYSCYLDLYLIYHHAHFIFQVTKGSLDFGLSAHNSLVLGIVLLVIGAMLLVSPALAIRQSYKDFTYSENTQNYSSVREYDDHDYDMEDEDAPVVGIEYEDGLANEFPSEIELGSSINSSRTLPRRTSRTSEDSS